MSRQPAFRLVRAPPTRQPAVSKLNIPILTSYPVSISTSRVFSTSPRPTINKGFWTNEGRRKDTAAMLFQKAEELRLQHELLRQEEVRRREKEEVRRQQEAVSSNMCVS